jgi:hypothetical protein
MHKLNTYGTWEDNKLFWTNELINCSKDKKLKKNLKASKDKHEYDNKSNKSNRKYSNKTENKNKESNQVIFNCRKKKINSNQLS